MTGAVTDEKLMALADGELPEAEAAELRTLIAGDPELAERFALFAETAALLAPDPAADAASVPDHLRAAVLRMANEASAANGQPANPLARFAVVPGGAAAEPVKPVKIETPHAKPRTERTWLMPIAASVALMVGGFLGYGLSGLTGDRGAFDMAAFPGARGALSEALASSPSGQTRAWTDQRRGEAGVVAVVATHQMAGGGVCREAEITGGASAAKQTIIACRKDGQWRTQAMIATGGATGFSPASGAHAMAEQLLEALGSERVLSAAEEAAFLAGK